MFVPTALVHVSKPVENEYSGSEIKELVETVADEYGVDTKDVATDINYEVKGSFTVENVDPAQEDHVEELIKNSVSQQTGVPTDDINIKYNRQ